MAKFGEGLSGRNFLDSLTDKQQIADYKSVYNQQRQKGLKPDAAMDAAQLQTVLKYQNVEAPAQMTAPSGNTAQKPLMQNPYTNNLFQRMFGSNRNPSTITEQDRQQAAWKPSALSGRDFLDSLTERSEIDTFKSIYNRQRSAGMNTQAAMSAAQAGVEEGRAGLQTAASRKIQMEEASEDLNNVLGNRQMNGTDMWNTFDVADQDVVLRHIAEARANGGSVVDAIYDGLEEIGAAEKYGANQRWTPSAAPEAPKQEFDFDTKQSDVERYNLDQQDAGMRSEYETLAGQERKLQQQLEAMADAIRVGESTDYEAYEALEAQLEQVRSRMTGVEEEQEAFEAAKNAEPTRPEGRSAGEITREIEERQAMIDRITNELSYHNYRDAENPDLARRRARANMNQLQQEIEQLQEELQQAQSAEADYEQQMDQFLNESGLASPYVQGGVGERGLIGDELGRDTALAAVNYLAQGYHGLFHGIATGEHYVAEKLLGVDNAVTKFLQKSKDFWGGQEALATNASKANAGLAQKHVYDAVQKIIADPEVAAVVGESAKNAVKVLDDYLVGPTFRNLGRMMPGAMLDVAMSGMSAAYDITRTATEAIGAWAGRGLGSQLASGVQAAMSNPGFGVTYASEYFESLAEKIDAGQEPTPTDMVWMAASSYISALIEYGGDDVASGFQAVLMDEVGGFKGFIHAEIGEPIEEITQQFTKRVGENISSYLQTGKPVYTLYGDEPGQSLINLAELWDTTWQTWIATAGMTGTHYAVGLLRNGIVKVNRGEELDTDELAALREFDEWMRNKAQETEQHDAFEQAVQDPNAETPAERDDGIREMTPEEARAEAAKALTEDERMPELPGETQTAQETPAQPEQAAQTAAEPAQPTMSERIMQEIEAGAAPGPNFGSMSDSQLIQLLERRMLQDQRQMSGQQQALMAMTDEQLMDAANGAGEYANIPREDQMAARALLNARRNEAGLNRLQEMSVDELEAELTARNAGEGDVALVGLTDQQVMDRRNELVNEQLAPAEQAAPAAEQAEPAAEQTAEEAAAEQAEAEQEAAEAEQAKEEEAAEPDFIDMTPEEVDKYVSEQATKGPDNILPSFEPYKGSDLAAGMSEDELKQAAKHAIGRKQLFDRSNRNRGLGEWKMNLAQSMIFQARQQADTERWRQAEALAGHEVSADEIYEHEKQFKTEEAARLELEKKNQKPERADVPEQVAQGEVEDGREVEVTPTVEGRTEDDNRPEPKPELPETPADQEQRAEEPEAQEAPAQQEQEAQRAGEEEKLATGTDTEQFVPDRKPEQPESIEDRQKTAEQPEARTAEAQPEQQSPQQQAAEMLATGTSEYDNRPEPKPEQPAEIADQGTAAQAVETQTSEQPEQQTAQAQAETQTETPIMQGEGLEEEQRGEGGQEETRQTTAESETNVDPRIAQETEAEAKSYGFKAGRTTGDGSQDTGVHLVNTGKLTRERAGELEVIDRIAKEFGFSVEVGDYDSRINGRYDGERTVYLNKNTGNALETVTGHEMYHMVQRISPESARKIEKIFDQWAARSADFDLQTRIEEVKERYERFGKPLKNDAEAKEELIANSFYNFISDPETMRQVYQADRSILERVMDFVRKVQHAIQEMLDRYETNTPEARMLAEQAGALDEMYSAMREALTDMQQLSETKKAATPVAPVGKATQKYRQAVQDATNKRQITRAGRELAGELLRQSGNEVNEDNITRMMYAAQEVAEGNTQPAYALMNNNLKGTMLDAEVRRGMQMLGGLVWDTVRSNDGAEFNALIMGEAEEEKTESRYQIPDTFNEPKEKGEVIRQRYTEDLINGSIKLQMYEHWDELKAMKPVSRVNPNIDITEYAKEAYDTRSALRNAMVGLTKRLNELLHRTGMPEIIFNRRSVNKNNHLSNTDMRFMDAIPDVVEKGMVVNEHYKHKKYSDVEHSVTFGGPVTTPDGTKYMGVVVHKTNGMERYYTHKVLLPNGKEYVFAENEKAGLAHYGELPEGNQPNTAPASKWSIAQAEDKVNDEVSDVRYSLPMEQPVEETRDLVAVHNLSKEKLEGALELGGMPMPSIAVTKSNIGHSTYGEVSLVFGKDTVDPKNPQNKVYGRDAWTTTFPSVDRPINQAKSDQLYSDLNKAGKGLPEYLKHNILRVTQYLNDESMSDYNALELVKNARDNTGLMAAYMAEKGETVVPVMGHEAPKPAWSVEREKWFDKLYTDLAGIVDSKEEFNSAPMKEMDERLEKTDERYARLPKPRRRTVLSGMYNYLNRVMTEERTFIDEAETDKKIREKINQEEYQKWLSKKLDGLFGDKAIAKDVDRYTASGNRKSFAQTHAAYTLDNIVREMRKKAGKAEQSGFMTGYNRFAGAAAKEYKSIDEMHADEGRLTEWSEEIQKKYEAGQNELLELISEIKKYRKKSAVDNEFIVNDIITQNLVEAATGKQTVADVRRILKQNYPDISDEIVKKAVKVIKEAAELPAMYYEAKPLRGVGLSEVRLAVVPESTDQALINRLKEAGVGEVLTYPDGDEDARREIINNADQVKFSVNEDDVSDGRDIWEEWLDGTVTGGQDAIELLKRMQEIQRGRKTHESGDWKQDVKRIVKDMTMYIGTGNLTDREVEKRLTQIFTELDGEESTGDKANERVGLALSDLRGLITEILSENAYSDTYRGVLQALRGGFFLTEGMKQELGGSAEIRDFRTALSGIARVYSNEFTGRKKNVRQRDLRHIWEEQLTKLDPAAFTADANEQEMANRLLDYIEQHRDMSTYLDPQTRNMVAEQALTTLAEYYAAAEPGPDTDTQKARQALARMTGRVAELEEQQTMLLRKMSQLMNQGRQAEGREQKQAASEELRKAQAEALALGKELDKAQKEHEKLYDAIKVKDNRAAYLENVINQLKKKNAADQKAAVKEDRARVRARAAQRAEAVKARQNIRKTEMKMRRMLEKPSNTAYVPLDRVRQLLNLVEAVMNSDTRKAAQAGENWMRAAREMRQDVSNSFVRDAYDEGFINQMQDACDILKDKSINQLEGEELQYVSNTLTQALHQIENATKIIGEDRKTDALVEAHSMTETFNAHKPQATGGLAKGLQSLATEHLNPESEFNKLAGYRTDNAVYRRGQALIRGQRDMNRIKMEMTKRFEPLMTGQNAKLFKKFQGKGAEVIDTGIAGSRHGTFKITQSTRAAIYLHSLNQQNVDGMKNGVTVPDYELMKKGKIREAWDRAERMKLSESDMRKITAGMSEYEKAWCKAWQDMQAYITPILNNVSMELNGWHRFTVENYFPIRRDGNYLATDFESLMSDDRIKNMGFTKLRKNASNPMMLEDLYSVVNRTINGSSLYAGMLIPVTNFNKVFNASLPGYEDSPKAALRRVFGNKEYEYIERMMKDVQQAGVRTDSSLLDKVRSKAAPAALGANLSVIIKQAASYPTAAATIGWRPLMRALSSTRRFDQKIVGKYTSAYWERTSANIQAMNANTQNSTIDRTSSWLNAPISGMDKATVRKIWIACEYAVEEQRKDLQRGTDAYYEAVAEMYEHCLERTQPEYGVMQRPHILRSNNQLTKSVTMYKTQSFQNFNVLYDAVQDFRTQAKAYKDSHSAENKAELDRAKTKLARAASSQIVSAVVLALMTAVGKAVLHKPEPYQDDKGELTAESAAEQLSRDAISSMMGMVTGGSELFDLITGIIDGKAPYDIEAGAVSMVNDLYQSAYKLGVAATAIADSSLTTEQKWQKSQKAAESFLNSIAAMGGFPFNNLRNIYNSATKYVSDIRSGNVIEGLTRGDVTASNAARYMGEALQKGDTETYTRLYNRLISQGKTASQINSAMKTWMKQNDARIRAAAEAIDSGDVDEYYRIVGEMTDQGYGTANVVNAIEAVRKARAESEELRVESGENTPLSFDEIVRGQKDDEASVYTYAQMNALLDDGNTRAALSVQRQLFKSKGTTAVKSALTSYWKPKYQAAYQSRNRQELNRITKLLKTMGYSDSSIAKWKQVESEGGSSKKSTSRFGGTFGSSKKSSSKKKSTSRFGGGFGR